MTHNDATMNRSSIKFTDENPDGFSLEHNQVRPGVWTNILRWLSSDMLPSTSISRANHGKLMHVPIPWESGPEMQGRKVAQFGNCRYDYIADIAEQCDPSPTNDASGAPQPIPDYIRQTLLSEHQHNCEQYTQCIINKYEATNEIPWHLDHGHFGPEVLVYTFGEERPLLLRKQINRDSATGLARMDGDQRENNDGALSYIYARVFPRHCSKYLLSREVRHVWEHSVPSGKGERFSITFRSWVGP